MSIAQQVSTRGTCNRKQVGAIIVKDKRILATGYNGSMSGAVHCDTVGHQIVDNHCVRTVHAEINAIVQCAKYGIGCNNATIYINTFPCWECFKATVNSGIKEIYYTDDYAAKNKDLVVNAAHTLKIKLEKID